MPNKYLILIQLILVIAAQLSFAEQFLLRLSNKSSLKIAKMHSKLYDPIAAQDAIIQA